MKEIPSSGTYFMDASSQDVIKAAADKIAQETIDPYPDLKWNEVSTRDEITTLISSLKIGEAVKIKITEDMEYGSANFMKVTQGTVVFDLNGHVIIGFSTVFNAFGEDAKIIINDSVGSGMIKGTKLNAVNGVIQARDGGTLVLNNGKIHTSLVDGDLLYGVYVLTGSKFIMNGGEIKSWSPAIDKELGDVSIKSGHVHSIANCAVVSCGQGAMKIYGDAKLDGGILQYVGHVTVSGNAIVNQVTYTTYDGSVLPLEDSENIGEMATYDEPSGRISPRIPCPITSFTGLYGDPIFVGDKGNESTLVVERDAIIKSVYPGPTVQIATVNTGYDQKIDVRLRKETYKIYSHDELAHLCEIGKFQKTLKPETKTTDISISGGIQR